jgi:hypothetical protein
VVATRQRILGIDGGARSGQQPRFAHLMGRPGMALRAVLVALILIVALPIVLMVIAAGVVFVLFAATIFAGRRALSRLRAGGWLPRGDGRQNVRVITRQAL